MKAQFFILGALLLATLFFAGLPITGHLVRTVSDDMEQFSENLEMEFPHAMNLANDLGDIERLGDFSAFADSQITQRNAEFRNLWVVTEPIGSNVNVTVGNYLDEDMTVVLNISNNIQMLLIPANAEDSVMYFGVPSQFLLRVTVPELDRELTLQRDKINMYSFFSLSRGEDFIRKEVLA